MFDFYFFPDYSTNCGPIFKIISNCSRGYNPEKVPCKLNQDQMMEFQGSANNNPINIMRIYKGKDIQKDADHNKKLKTPCYLNNPD